MSENNSDKVTETTTDTSQQTSEKHPKKIKSRLLVIIVVILVLIVGGAVVYSKRVGQNIYTRSHESPNENKNSVALTDEEKFVNGATNSVDVKITKDGFTPAVLTVKPDTRVTWITDEADNNYGVAANAGSKVTQYFGSKTDVSLHNLYAARFVDEGTYTYHDTKNPTHNGTIIVTK